MRLSETKTDTQVSILDFNYYKKYNCVPLVVKGTSVCHKKKEKPKRKPPIPPKKLISCHAKHLQEIISLTCKVIENITILLTVEDFCEDPCIKKPSLFDCIMPEICKLLKCIHELMLCTCRNNDPVIECFLCKIKKCVDLVCDIAFCCEKRDPFDIVDILKKVQRKLCHFKRIISVHEKLVFDEGVKRKLEKYNEKKKKYITDQ